jgi:aerobic-type carbon monoxide dehydrogenase small subunit (CoxS/CutS family)
VHYAIVWSVGRAPLEPPPQPSHHDVVAKFDLRINGAVHVVDVDPAMPLLWVLRDVLSLTGTKFGCGIGACGTCSLWLDGVPERACITAVGAVGTREVTTIEGLARDLDEPTLRAWRECSVPQCGYCQPAQVMRAAALARRSPPPSAAEVAAEMDQVLCRCGTQPKIAEALARCLRR